MKAPFLMIWLCLILALGGVASAEGEKAEELHYPDLVLGGQLQLQLDDGDLRTNARRPVRNGIGTRRTDSRIDIRRLRLYAKLAFSPEWSIVTETDFEPEDLEPEEITLTPLDLYLKYDFADGHHLRIGQAKVPFGLEFFRSSRLLTVIERADTSRTLFQRDIGIGVFGENGKADYGFGFYQGQGENEPELNGINDMVGKFGYQVTPGLRLGASGHLGAHRPDRAADDIAVRRLGVEAEFHDGPWRVEGEYILSDGYNLFSDGDTPARGYYLYNIFTVRPPLDLVVGYDRFDPDVGSYNPLRSDNRANERDRFTLGLNYYLARDPVHRFMVNYEIRNELEGPSISAQGFRVRYQYTW